MNRDDAIKAVQVAALKKWAPRMDGLTTWEAGVVVDAVDPIIRADERGAHGERIAQAIEKVAAGWVQYQRMPENTTHIAYVHENGAVYDPERGWLSSEDALMDHADPLISRDDAAAIAREELETMEERYCPECGRDVLTERRLAASECAECDGWALRYAHAAVRELCTPAPPTRQE